MLHNIDTQKLENTLSQLEQLFLSKDFQGIERLTGGIRLRANEIENALTQYPDEPLGLNRGSLDIIRVEEAHSPRWSVNIRFKSMRGDSDLTLSLFLQDAGVESDLYKTEIADIHVL